MFEEDLLTAITVLLADDQRLMREGLATLLALADGIEIVGQAADGQEAIDLAKRLKPDVILMDIQMPRVDGIAATQTIKAALPETKIIMLTTFSDDEYLMAGLRAGAIGYLLKDMPSEQLAEAIRSAAKGQSPIGPEMARKLVNLVTQAAPVSKSTVVSELSDREIEVLKWIAAGLSNKEIAEKLVIAEGTAKNHVSNILSKLEARDRAQAVARAKELGLV